MSNEHPITPPPELVQQWYDAARGPRCEQELATQAARWGADHEFAECFQWVESHVSTNRARLLRAARRPKPPSLKEQALDALRDLHQLYPSSHQTVTIRHALEQLPD